MHKYIFQFILLYYHYSSIHTQFPLQTLTNTFLFLYFDMIDGSRPCISIARCTFLIAELIQMICFFAYILNVQFSIAVQQFVAYEINCFDVIFKRPLDKQLGFGCGLPLCFCIQPNRCSFHWKCKNFAMVFNVFSNESLTKLS